jgi:hypothetical protein
MPTRISVLWRGGRKADSIPLLWRGGGNADSIPLLWRGGRKAGVVHELHHRHHILQHVDHRNPNHDIPGLRRNAPRRPSYSSRPSCVDDGVADDLLTVEDRTVQLAALALIPREGFVEQARLRQYLCPRFEFPVVSFTTPPFGHPSKGGEFIPSGFPSKGGEFIPSGFPSKGGEFIPSGFPSKGGEFNLRAPLQGRKTHPSDIPPEASPPPRQTTPSRMTVVTNSS